VESGEGIERAELRDQGHHDVSEWNPEKELKGETSGASVFDVREWNPEKELKVVPAFPRTMRP